MGRGLISGLIWGAFISIVAAVLLSLGLPLPDRPQQDQPAPQQVSELPTVSADPAETPDAMPEAAPVEADTPDAAPVTGPGAASQPASEIPLPAGSEFNRPPEETAAALPGIDTAPAGAPQAITALPAPTAPNLPDTAPAPQPEAMDSLQAPSAAPVLETPAANPGARLDPSPPVAEEQPAPLGLPQIETGPEAQTETAPLGRPLQPVESGDAADPDAPRRAIDAFATPFDAEESRPLMAVILIDDPSFPLGRDALTRFDFPVAFAIDPRRPDAAEAASTYRAAGFEVLLLAEIFTEDTGPAQAEEVLTRGFDRLPEAVAVLDTSEGAIQGRRELLDGVVEVLAETGHGLVAYPRGLNAAEQTATRAAVPAATLFREIDSERERATVITRYLDRAAFAAGQEGGVIVVGHTYSDTVTALFSWALGSRSEAVAMAPVSAVLTR
jgi:uncharacterized protein